MSDGNFNRALLPKNELGAGLRMGKAQMRQKATDALDTILSEYLPDLPEDRKTEMKERFKELLR